MKKVTITVAVAALLFALAAGAAALSTGQEHHDGAYNSARHHASLPPVW
jgi:hypothetical protein